MRIALLGGSFNPIHIGHLALADEVCASLGYDKVLFVPSYNPPHKEILCGATARERLEMVRLACQADERFEDEACEIERGGLSYTYDTVCEVEKKYADVLEGKLGLIIGEDLLSGFCLWHRAKELSERCTLILALRPIPAQGGDYANKPRGDYALLGSSKNSSDADSFFEGAIKLKNMRLDISSTEIRERVAKKKGIRYLVPNAVFEYIVKGNIYGRDK